MNKYKVTEIVKNNKEKIRFYAVTEVNSEPYLIRFDTKKSIKTSINKMKHIVIKDAGAFFISFSNPKTLVAKLICDSAIYQFKYPHQDQTSFFDEVNAKLKTYMAKMEKETLRTSDFYETTYERQMTSNDDMITCDDYQSDVLDSIFQESEISADYNCNLTPIIYSNDVLEFEPRIPRVRFTENGFQIMNLKQHMSHPGGVEITMKGQSLVNLNVAFFKSFVYVKNVKNFDAVDLPIYSGDVICKLSGTLIDSMEHFNELIKSAKELPTISLVIQRIPKGKCKDIKAPYLTKFLKNYISIKVEQNWYYLTQVNKFNALSCDTKEDIKKILEEGSSFAAIYHPRNFIKQLKILTRNSI